MNEWEQEGRVFKVPSDSAPSIHWTVTVRPDTKNGGTYLHCDCPSWPQSVSKGGCKHVIRVRGGRGVSFTCHQCTVVDDSGKPRLMRFETVIDLHRHVERAHQQQPRNQADIDAAARILAWKGA